MRKTKEVIVPLDGRDKGKKFLITEMPASTAEKWAARAFLALAHAGIEIPEELQGAGMAAIAIVGLRALGRVSWEEAEPLMDEMMACIQSVQPAITRPVIEEDIEEVTTRMWLRSEVFELHCGFSIAGAVLTPAAAEVIQSEQTSQPTRMYRR